MRRKHFALIVITAACVLFAIVAVNATAGQPLAALDARIAMWLRAHAFAALTQVLLVITHLHAPVALWIYTAVLAWLFAKRRQWSWVITLAVAVPAGLAVNGVLKHVFQRARPAFDSPLLTAAGYSFPSGHTAGAVLFYGTIAAYALARWRGAGARTACVLLWLAMVGTVGFSRMYLGVHYLSDILGAIAWSLAWLAVAMWAGHAFARGRPEPRA